MAYRRSILIINRRFQFRFCVYVCSWLLALCFIYPFIVENIFGYFIQYISQDPLGPPVEGILKTRNEIITLLIMIQVVFLGITLIVSLFLSHRIAGPLYKLSIAFNKARMGNLKEEVRFRNKDHFTELADSYNDMLRGLRHTVGKQLQNITQVLQELETLKSQSSLEASRDRPKIERCMTQLKEIRDKLPQ